MAIKVALYAENKGNVPNNTIHCELSHGKEKALYEFWMKDKGSWSIIQRFSKSPSVKVNFSESGNYAISVTAKLSSDVNDEYIDVRTILHDYNEKNIRELGKKELNIDPLRLNEDLDGDNANQYIEYIYHTNPFKPDSGSRLAIETLENDELCLTLKKPKEITSVKSILIEQSNDFINWNECHRVLELESQTDHYRIVLPKTATKYQGIYYRATITLKGFL